MATSSSLQPALVALLSRTPPLLQAARSASFRWDERCVRALRGPHAFRAGRPALVGFLRSSIGIGALARMHGKALRGLGLAPVPLDVGPAFGLAPAVEGWPGPEEPAAGDGPALLHVNPPELPRALRAAGVEALRGRWLIGCWNWELPDLDPGWHRAFRFVDEVWVASRFTAGALGERPPVPVRVVPPPVPPAPPRRRSRAELGLPEDAVVFLTAFDMRSSMERKNPLGAIRAFRRALDRSRDALLLVKVAHGEQAPERFALLRRAAADAPNVRVLTGLLDDAGMSELLYACDAVLSLHRAEGFGLLLAEAMRRGRCVIATDWSGSRDFLHPGNGLPVGYTLRPVRDEQGLYRSRPGRVWAEPDLDEAVDCIRAVATQPSLRERLGARARRDAELLFAAERFAKAAGASLRACLEHECGGR